MYVGIYICDTHAHTCTYIYNTCACVKCFGFKCSSPRHIVLYIYIHIELHTSTHTFSHTLHLDVTRHKVSRRFLAMLQLLVKGCNCPFCQGALIKSIWMHLAESFE